MRRTLFILIIAFATAAVLGADRTDEQITNAAAFELDGVSFKTTAQEFLRRFPEAQKITGSKLFDAVKLKDGSPILRMEMPGVAFDGIGSVRFATAIQPTEKDKSVEVFHVAFYKNRPWYIRLYTAGDSAVRLGGVRGMSERIAAKYGEATSAERAKDSEDGFIYTWDIQESGRLFELSGYDSGVLLDVYDTATKAALEAELRKAANAVLIDDVGFSTTIEKLKELHPKVEIKNSSDSVVMASYRTATGEAMTVSYFNDRVLHIEKRYSARQLEKVAGNKPQSDADVFKAMTGREPPDRYKALYEPFEAIGSLSGPPTRFYSKTKFPSLDSPAPEAQKNQKAKTNNRTDRFVQDFKWTVPGSDKEFNFIVSQRGSEIEAAILAVDTTLKKAMVEAKTAAEGDKSK